MTCPTYSSLEIKEVVSRVRVDLKTAAHLIKAVVNMFNYLASIFCLLNRCENS